MTIETYRDVRAWQKSMDLAEKVYSASSAWPRSERHGLVSQERRAAVSVPSNIAEGYGRESEGSYIQFLKTARGSLCELETQFEIATRVHLADAVQAAAIRDEINIVGKMLSGLIRSSSCSEA